MSGATGRADETTRERRLGPRFGPEAGLIVAAAAFAALIELSWPGVVAVVLGAWLAVAIFEIVRARVRPAATEDRAPPPPETQPGIGSEPGERFAPRLPAEVEPPVEPELVREPEPPQQQSASLAAAPEQVEPASPPEQERRS